MKKQIITGALAISLVAGGAVALAEEEQTIETFPPAVEEQVDQVRTLDISGVVGYDKDGSLMLPLREVAEGILGLDVKWIQETYSVEVGSGPQWTSISIGKNAYFFARVAPFPLSQAPEIRDGMTYVPVDFFTEVLKYEVQLEEEKPGTEEEAPEKEEQILQGFVKDIRQIEDRTSILVAGNEKNKGLDEILLHIGEDALIVDNDEKEFKLEDLKIGHKISTILPEIMTLSLPPQGSAVKIIVEDTSVSLERLAVEGEEIAYPNLKGIEKVDEKVNESIEGFVKELKGNELYEDLKLDYQVSLLSDEKLSIVFYGSYKMGEEEKQLVKSLNFDLEDAKVIDFASYFKEDEETQKKLEEVLEKAAQEQLDKEFEAEGKFIFFKGSQVVVYYYELDDSVSTPSYLYLGLEDLKDLVK